MRGSVRGVLRVALPLALAVLASMAFAVSGAAGEGVYEFGNVPSSTTAGGHPDVITSLEIENRKHSEVESPCYCHDPKDILVHSPAGLVANTHVVSICTPDQIS